LHSGGLIVGKGEDAEAWWDDVGGKPAIVRDATFVNDDGSSIMRLPWGARVALTGSVARLPDGSAGRLTDGRWATWEELVAGYPQTGDAVVETAREWAGTPYVWGGRTRWGSDCSGLVQAVYRLHGFLLPRDSYQQAEIGEPIDVGAGFAILEPGDLLFFRGDEAPGVVHVALSLGGAGILHAAQGHGLVAEDELTGGSPLQRSLAESLVGARRLFW
jgi:cell wall-associated NlpC family hydrolase